MNVAKSHARVTIGNTSKISSTILRRTHLASSSYRQYAPVPHCSSSATDANANPPRLWTGNATDFDEWFAKSRSGVVHDRSSALTEGKLGCYATAAVAFKTLIPDVSLLTRDRAASVKIVGTNLYVRPLRRYTTCDNMLRDAYDVGMRYVTECQDTFRAANEFECTVTLKVRATPDVIYWANEADGTLNCNVLVHADVCQV